MDKFRLQQILNVLLMPYREPEFETCEKDIIAKLRRQFALLQRHAQDSLYDRRYYEKKYYEAERQLAKFVRKHTELQVRNIDDFRLLINLFYPEQEISHMYQRYWEEKKDCQYLMELFYLKNIYRMSDSLITFRDGKAAIRTWRNLPLRGKKDIFDYPAVFDKVQIWNLLCRMIVPDVVIAAFYVEDGLKDVAYLYNQHSSISLSDKILEKVLEKGLAETHCHFNAGLTYSVLWQTYMDPGRWEKASDSRESYKNFCGRIRLGIEILIYRIVWADYLEEKKGRSLEQYISSEYSWCADEIFLMLARIADGQQMDYSDKMMRFLYSFRLHMSERCGESDYADYLMGGLYRKYRRYAASSEMILLFKSLLFFREEKCPDLYAHLFVQYLRRKNMFYEDILQDNLVQGLANFQMHYKEMGIRNRIFGSREGCRLVFQSFFAVSHLRKLELRLSPDMKISEENIGKKHLEYPSLRYEIKCNLLKSIRTVLAAYLEAIADQAVAAAGFGKQEALSRLDALCREGKVSIPTIGLIFNFSKRDYVDNRVGNMCWVRDGENPEFYSRHMIRWRRMMTVCAKAIEELRAEIPYLGRYIVGIDAASEENTSEPWIFAPVYAAIRSRKTARPLIEVNGRAEYLNNIGFTYHVGEEFRHLLSGLRHIDEVIEHFHYKPGDRLGHAIALGEDIKYWISRNKAVVIPVMEQLENLLWLWGNQVYHSWNIGISTETLEGRILTLAKMIYGDITGMNAHILFEAYNEKFRLNYEKIFSEIKEKYILEQEMEENTCPDGLQHFCRYYDIKSPHGVIWTKEKIFCTFFCPIYYEKLYQPILVDVPEEDCVWLQKVQDYLIRKVEQKGIYIEVNPTSNLAIGEIQSLDEGHIFNLNSKGVREADKVKNEVLVTVSSDDPLIFNTNCENELAYAYHALVYKNYKKESVLEWIDKIRQMGIDSSFIKEERRPSIQYKEIEMIINEIDRFCKTK